jgi:hypothetical protein
MDYHISLSLRDKALALNQLALDSLPADGNSIIFYVEDYKNDERIPNVERFKVFKKGTKFPSVVTCKVGVKVMFLINSMLSSKEIANGLLGVITDILYNGDIEAVFLIEEGIQVR